MPGKQVMMLAAVMGLGLAGAGLCAQETVPAAAPAVPEFVRPLLGVWQETVDNEVLRFEADRATALFKGQRTYFIAHYEPGRVALFSWGRIIETEAAVDGDTLTLVTNGKKGTYRRQAAAPEGLDVTPLALGAAGDVPAETAAALQKELAERVREDQAVRTDPARQKDMQSVDRVNTGRLIELVRQYGWIDAGRFGAAAANDAFLIVQHSGDLPLMLAALPLIEGDVKGGRLDGQPYALLFDRLNLNLGRRQRFGTQVGQDAGGVMTVMPLEDREQVEAFRKAIGIMPLAAYLKYFEQANRGKPVTFMEFPAPPPAPAAPAPVPEGAPAATGEQPPATKEPPPSAPSGPAPESK